MRGPAWGSRGVAGRLGAHGMNELSGSPVGRLRARVARTSRTFIRRHPRESSNAGP